MLEVSQLLDPTCLAPHIKHHHWYVVRNIAWLLGRMGSGTENILLEAVDYPHRKVKTEALRSLAMVATPTSISLIFRLLSTGDRTVRRTAIEFVANLPVTILEPHLMKVLSSKEFIKRDPAVTVVLIDALARVDQQGAERILADIAGMRFILWNWKCVRVGIRAYQALRRGHHNHSPRQPAASTQRESGEQGNP